ncbi:hypothetical protein CF326_g2808 [Tilletia indica]|nr:hypothetical protein CF326_g2808 [Tilletia indica]
MPPTATTLSPSPASPLGITHPNPSESWTAPDDIDGALIRRTYAHFDLIGVHGDGITDGIELTRERTHPLPFAWSTDRRSQSRASNSRQLATSSSGSPLNNADTTTTTARNGVRLKKLILAPQPQATTTTTISFGAMPSPSAQSHATSVSDYMSVEGGGPQSTTPQPPLPPEFNLTPATPLLEANNSFSSSAGFPRSSAPPSPSTLHGGAGGSTPADSQPPSPTSPTSASAPPVTAKATKKQEEERLLDERLRITDRYGFFANSLATSSHAKAVVLPSNSEIPDPVRTVLLRREHESALRQRERIRIDKWARMLTVSERDDGGNAILYTFRDKAGIGSVAGTGRSKKLRRRCYKGIPDRWRSVAWLALLERRTVGPNGEGNQSPPFSELVSRYDRLLGEASSFDVQIDLDVPRTMSGHLLFHTRYGQGQRALFHVLHAFSLHCPECGYCQGMGPIAASLLCYLEPSRAYVALVRLHDVHRLHDIFASGFPGLLENFYVQEQLIRWLFPPLAAMLDEHGIDSSSFATKWYITLFANSVPFETQLRMWDVVFLDGQDALVGIALGVLHGIQNRLLIGDTIAFDTEPWYEDAVSQPPSSSHLESNSHTASENGNGNGSGPHYANGNGHASEKSDDANVNKPSKRRAGRLNKRPSALSDRSRTKKKQQQTHPSAKTNGSAVSSGDPQHGPTTPSFESVLGALTSYVVPASDGALMGWVSDLMARTEVRARMKAARVEWVALKAGAGKGK